jgi:hypothetical protein
MEAQVVKRTTANRCGLFDFRCKERDVESQQPARQNRKQWGFVYPAVLFAILTCYGMKRIADFLHR